VYDGQWRCRSGYKRSGDFCVTLTAPAHATLESGGRWECDWGFRKVGSRCDEINPPPHAYIDASGRDWLCFPGWQKNSDGCAPAETSGPKEPAGATTAPDEPKPPP